MKELILGEKSGRGPGFSNRYMNGVCVSFR